MMKKIISASLVAICASFSACGDGAATRETVLLKTTTSIGGEVEGFPSGLFLFLSNNGGETISVSRDGAFAFNRRVNEGGIYKVSVLGQPSGTDCDVQNGSGTIMHGIESISNIKISCHAVASSAVQFNVGVTISGLQSEKSITLSNNGNEFLTATDNGLFVFPMMYRTNVVYAGRAGGYDVAIQSNPTGQTCVLSNASGGVSAPISNNFVHVFADCK